MKFMIMHLCCFLLEFVLLQQLSRPWRKSKGKQKAYEADDSSDSEEESSSSSDLWSSQDELNDLDEELELKKEPSELDLELTVLKKQVRNLYMEHEFLKNEAEQTRQKTHDCLTYISHEAEKRECLIMMLRHQYQKQLEAMEAQGKEEKAGLHAMLVEKEARLSEIQQEIQALKIFQKKRKTEIGQFEQELELERLGYEDEIHSIRTQFLRQKRHFREVSEAKIKELAIQTNMMFQKKRKTEIGQFQHELELKRLGCGDETRTQFFVQKRQIKEAAETKIKETALDANKKASECLKEHIRQMWVENKQLHNELQELVEITDALQQLKKKLEKQYRDLMYHQLSGWRARGSSVHSVGSRPVKHHSESESTSSAESKPTSLDLESKQISAKSKPMASGLESNHSSESSTESKPVVSGLESNYSSESSAESKPMVPGLELESS